MALHATQGLFWREWFLLFVPFKPRDLLPGLVVGLFVLATLLSKMGISPLQHPALFLSVMGLLFTFFGAKALPKSVRLWLARNPWLGFLEDDDAALEAEAQPSPLPEPIPMSEPAESGPTAVIRKRQESYRSDDPTDRLRRSIMARVDPLRFPRGSIRNIKVNAHFGKALAGHANVRAECLPRQGLPSRQATA